MKPHICQLAELKDICAVRRMDLDMQVARAQTRVHALEDRRREEASALAAFQDGWRQSVSGRFYDLTASAFWSAAFLEADVKSVSTAIDIQAAVETRRQLIRSRNVVAARHDALDDLLRSEQRRARTRSEEARMEAYAVYGSAGWDRA